MSDARAALETTNKWSSPAIGLSLSAALAIIGYLYRDTFWSMVSVWSQSDTFAHCFLILPISLALIWLRRHELRAAPKQLSPLGIAAAAALSLGWFVASAANVQVGEHLTATMLVPATVLAMIGPAAARTIAMPLIYLLFAVPFGEALIPALMDFTASFTVAALRLTGIPVLREGLYFSIPSGDFEVAKACSGVRYLIACTAVSALFAHVVYRSWRKRLLFMAASIVAPIIANGMRAYMIVMIAHLSDMRLAVGIDHLIYGWLFFAGLIALLFWLGSRFSDVLPMTAPTAPAPGKSDASRRSAIALGGTVVAVAVAAALGPALSLVWHERGFEQSAGVGGLPVLESAWKGPYDLTLVPSSTTAARTWRARYSSGPSDVDLYVLLYGGQSHGRESVGAIDAVISTYGSQVLERRTASGPRFRVVETVMRTAGGYRVLRHWYVVDGTAVSADWRTKLLEAWTLLFRGRADTAVVIASTEAADMETAKEALSSFLADGQSALCHCLTENRGCAPQQDD